ncbi:hypothetical protein NQ314_006958 [Rhamnusium bicolor]|uniref:PiggyBac transposable element-derived protein domain-containing protein n=1 Tax=Rhamnusium bicolor TaxID=1586634 RepID=A0AAV8YUC6_9CUCU|nr:hypothetical protein NQ314_006958 [Rhamnusium bicolor]
MVYWKKTLTLNELLEEVEYIDDENRLPDAVVLFPPINANDDVTDEDSGDDDNVIMDNLPGSVLNSQAEATFRTDSKIINILPSDSDSDDSVPLAQFCKYKKKQKKNDWVQEDIVRKLPDWQKELGAKNHRTPLEIFLSFFF